MNNTYILLESKRNELITAINNVETFYDLCFNNNRYSDDLKLLSISVMREIDEVKAFMATECHSIDDAFNRRLAYDNFLNDAQELQREMRIADRKCF